MIYDANLQMLFFKGFLIAKHNYLITMPQLTVSRSFSIVLFNSPAFLLLQISETSSRSHQTTKPTFQVLSLHTHLIMVNICISSNDNALLNSCF